MLLNVIDSFFFVLMRVFIAQINHKLFIHYPVEYLECFEVGTITNKAVMIIQVKSSGEYYVFIFLDITPHRKLPKFLQCLHNFTSPPTCTNPHVLQSHQSLVLSVYLTLALLGGVNKSYRWWISTFLMLFFFKNWGIVDIHTFSCSYWLFSVFCKPSVQILWPF